MVFLPGILTCVSALFVFSFFVSTKLVHVIALPGFAFFPLALVDCAVIILFELTIAGFVHAKSNQLLNSWEKVGRKSGIRMSIKSLTPLKVRMGSNYVDKFTALVVLDFCVSQTASLLMMS